MDGQTRPFHAYCVGDAKSGTASMTGMLETHFRSAHEPERSQLLDRVVAYDQGRVSRVRLDAYLGERDDRMRLDFDSSWANYFVMGRLVALFPDARFIQLVRDCYTWVESIVNHLGTRTIPRDVRQVMDWWFKPELYPHTKDDRALEEAGMHSLECYLTRWRNQAVRPSNEIASDRLLIVRTHELSHSFEPIARFLDIHPELIDGARSHWNKGTKVKPILTLVDKSYLEETIARVCQDAMGRFFPEVTCSEDAVKPYQRAEL